MEKTVRNSEFRNQKMLILDCKLLILNGPFEHQPITTCFPPAIGCQRTSSGLLFTDADMVEESSKIADPEPQEVPKWMETLRLRG